MPDADSFKDKDSEDLERAEHVGDQSEHTTAASRPKTTTRNGTEVVPQPSDDPRDPLSWPMSKKILIYCVMVFGTFTGIATAVANVLATPEQAMTWNTSPTRAAYSVSAVLGGIIIGPILLVPLVRVFGVMSCCFWSLIFVAVTSVWSAVSTQQDSYGSFVASRFVAGIFCPVPQIFTSGVIAHIFFLHQRGKAFAVYSTIYMIAQVAGPTFSGYIVEYVEWPVVFWWTVGANALAAVLFFLFGEETAWDREQNRPVAKHEIPKSWLGRRVALFFFGTRVAPPGPLRSSAKSLQAVFAIGFSPVTVLAGIYGLFAFGWYIMAGVQVPLILAEPPSQGGYGFSPLGTANFYFSAWIGAIVGVAYGILVNDRLPLWLQKRNNGVWKGEYRLYPAILPGLIVGPIGYGIFGASVYYGWSWAVLATGEALLVFAAVTSLPPTVNYIIEIWKHYPQEVGTALNVWRIAFSIAVQFIYEPWGKKVGVQWVWGTASFISLFGFGCVALLVWKGPYLRKFDLWPEDEDATQQKASSVMNGDDKA